MEDKKETGKTPARMVGEGILIAEGGVTFAQALAFTGQSLGMAPGHAARVGNGLEVDLGPVNTAALPPHLGIPRASDARLIMVFPDTPGEVK